mgnify:CR=1 FL=1
MDSIGSEQAKTRQPRRTFTKQFKAELVARVHEGQQSLAQIALDNHINANLLHKWVVLARDAAQPNLMVPVAIASNSNITESDVCSELNMTCGTIRISKSWYPAADA